MGKGTIRYGVLGFVCGIMGLAYLPTLIAQLILIGG